ncbi:MAG: DEAD/DEAH box helicase family protein, partial [Caldisphaeraceae archaeon]|nr:DEAD/DEAH box helicase family protein [Caldisphaeraceae archaeon]
PTGTGKTVLAASLILAMWKYYTRIKRKHLLAVFLTPRIVIRRQALEKFDNLLFYSSKGCLRVFEVGKSEEFCGLFHKYFGHQNNYFNKLVMGLPHLKRIYSKYRSYRLCRDVTKGVVFLATPQLLHSLYKNTKSECIDLLVSNIDMLIMDEIHTFYIGEEIIKTIKSFIDRKSIPIIIGLTATPVKEAKDLLGGLIYKKLSSEAMREGVLTPGLKIITYKTYVNNLRSINTSSIHEGDEWKFAIKESKKIC